MHRSQLRTLFVAAIFWVPLHGCSSHGASEVAPDGSPADTSQNDGGEGGTAKAEPSCAPIHTSLLYPPRSSITAGSVSSAPSKYFTSDLFSRFKIICGACHVDNSLGNFVVSEADFSSKVTQHVLDTIVSDDPAIYMPPANTGAPPYSQRLATDPVVQLVELLKLWLAQGSSMDSFDLPQATQSAVAGFALTPEEGAKMTNLGTCVPGRLIVGTATAEMDEKDKLFADATELPSTLDKTDLVTVDSEELAKRGVISFAPTYPLWMDNAGMMRYVRVPRGETITFDKTTQQFRIPANTRFYDTFLKRVIDVEGHSAWRKMETQVILSRPDKNGANGQAEAQTALFGTYVWNEDESGATLFADPLRNGEPFSDRVVSYITDEAKAKVIIDAKSSDRERQLKDAGLIRNYAFRGAIRCGDCHMGSPSQSFVLGFTPLQLNRRPTGVGGVYEPAVGDELTQVERLIDYGIISGLDSADEIRPLEAPQGTRAARTPEELAAQAYLMGNCAHCHNPRGLPSVNEPLLVDALNFFPSATGGVFQFPLDRMSLVRFRGIEQNTPVPYITPSLYDKPLTANELKAFCPNDPNWQSSGRGDCYTTGDLPDWILAPWRSLMYRNVDTPFDYFEDFLPYPHMPMHGPGFDCRAPRIVGDWMVSIPAELINKNTREDAFLSKDRTHFLNYVSDDGTVMTPNEDDQPYREVTPDSPNYPAAVAAARSRLQQYHAGPRYNFCPSTYADDIVDPVVTAEVEQHVPVEADTGYFTDPNDPTKLIMPLLQVPIRPNFIEYDPTDPPGPWFPRNPLWDPGIVDPSQIPAVVKKTITDGNSQATQDLTNVLEALQGVKLNDDLRTKLLQEVPMGLWDTSKPSCNFTGIPKVSDFTGTARPDWMNVANPAPAAPVYVESVGAAIYTTICSNCHGVLADSQGGIAGDIVNFTGGDARVANFRDGILGPVSNPGMNRERVFGPDATKLGITSDDMAVRYMAYMALGGTQKLLPAEVLREVAEAPVFGVTRSNLELLGSADMLQLGLALCEQIASASTDFAPLRVADLAQGRIKWSAHTGLIDTTGDAEMWVQLCSLGNRPIVRVVAPQSWMNTYGTGPLSAGELVFSGYSEYWGDAKGPDGLPLYPPDAPFMDHHGRLQMGSTIINSPFPICVAKPTDPQQLQLADAVLKSIAGGGPGNPVIPYCPAGLIAPANQLDPGIGTFPDAKKWAARGTINAAMAVFLYLDQIERDPSKSKPLYDECDQLSTTH
jgi:mono/diheme cytochrome c family protein